MEIIVGYGQLVVLAIFEYSRVLCVYLCICRYVNAMYVYLRVGASVCAYSTCTETCTLQYSLALQMSSHLVLEEALPELECSLDLSFSNVSCKQKLQNPSQTQFSLILIDSIVYHTHTQPHHPADRASLLPHCAEQSLQRPVVAAPCHLQRGRKEERHAAACLSVPESCGQGILQCRPKSLLVSDHEGYCRPRSMLDSNRLS